MGGMRVYRAPSGLTFQFREGKAPEGYVLVEPTEQPEAQPKRLTPRNKARKADNK